MLKTYPVHALLAEHLPPTRWLDACLIGWLASGRHLMNSCRICLAAGEVPPASSHPASRCLCAWNIIIRVLVPPPRRMQWGKAEIKVQKPKIKWIWNMVNHNTFSPLWVLYALQYTNILIRMDIHYTNSSLVVIVTIRLLPKFPSLPGFYRHLMLITISQQSIRHKIKNDLWHQTFATIIANKPLLKEQWGIRITA